MSSLIFLPLLLLMSLAQAWQPAVQTGLDVLVASNFTALDGKKVIILTNPTGATASLDPNVDVMVAAGVNLVGVMGPEHGFRGDAQAGSGSGGSFKDPQTGLTVYDAYNANYTSLVSFITDSGADTVVFDIQDVGARFYTCKWHPTSSNVPTFRHSTPPCNDFFTLESWTFPLTGSRRHMGNNTFVASTLCGTTFVLLDRPNPITGLNAYGPILNQSYASYVGRRPIAQSHGMTSGELAQMFMGAGWITDTAQTWSNLTREGVDVTNPKLQVVKMDGWNRGMAWKDTGLKFITPSPNIPTTTTASVYPGTCLFEGTSMSEGRGTTLPFELLGAGYANASWYTAARSVGVPHAWYRFACFVPTFSKFESVTACGLQTYLDFVEGPDYSSETYGSFDPVYLGVALVKTAHDLYTITGSNQTEGFHWLPNGANADLYDIDVLAGGPLIREGIEQGWTPEQIRDAWTPRLEDWKMNCRAKYLLY